ncbi:MAG TPA: LacI family DNA-binding transcriptional regulator [Chloroflexia bacterium]|nr:LacI family DNA-binding transcriptional regulator [Chloroflexia bacterium]
MAGPTIYDVSKRAGVSIATVSRVLNKRETVAIETRERVLSAIDELGFVPKIEAISRARKQLGRIGVLTPSFVDSIVDRMRGISEALIDLPYDTAIYNANTPYLVEGYLTSLAFNHVVDGLIIIGIDFDYSFAQRLVANRLPVVFLGDTESPIHEGFNALLLDHGEGGAMAARYLLDQGHRRFAFVGDAYPQMVSHSIGDSKLDRFRQTLAEAGVALPDSYVCLTTLDMEQTRQQVFRLLDLPKLPTAIFAGSDTQAIAVMSAARERGLSIPNDLAVMGFDDISIAQFVGLTTIHQPLRESGRLAVEMVLGQIEDNNKKAIRSEYPVSLIKRATA